MERNYKTIASLFLILAIASLAGFFRSYFQFFPNFENISSFTHIHFGIFFLWFLIIISQPILIQQQRNSLHKTIGRFTYILAPIMAVSILVMVKIAIDKNLIESQEQSIMAATGAILDTVVFLICYLVSIINSKNIRWHVAFMIGASLIVFNPGLGRLSSGIFSQQVAILAMVLFPILVSASIFIYDKIKYNRAILKSPYLLFILIWICEVVAFIALPQFGFWQKTIEKFANL